MNRFLTLVLALVVLAILQAAVAALVLALTIMLLFFLATRPRETLTYLGTFLLLGLASARPVAAIMVFGVVAVAVVIADVRRKSRNRMRLTDGREHGRSTQNS